MFKDWLSKYYKTICFGRMVEGIEFTPNELRNILSVIEKRIDIFSAFTSRLITNIPDKDISKDDLDFRVNSFLMVNYNDFYNIINDIFNYKTIKRRFSEKGLRYDLTFPSRALL